MARKFQKIKKHKPAKRRKSYNGIKSETRSVENITEKGLEGVLKVLKGKLIAIHLDPSGKHLGTEERLFSGYIAIEKK